MFFTSYSKKTDEELMVLITSGNPRAFSELYQRYSENLLRYFYKMLWNDKPLAQDFLHDLFLKIIERPANFNTEKKFSTWVFSVANNMCKNQYRKNEYHKIFQRVNSEQGPAFEDQAGSEEFARLLNDALQKLDEDERNLYVLRFEVELPLEEIASLMDCPVGTIKSKSFYLRKKIAALLEWYQNEKIKYG